MEFRVQGLGDLGFRVEGLGVQGLGLRVWRRWALRAEVRCVGPLELRDVFCCQDAMAIDLAVVPLLKIDGYRTPSGSTTAGISASLGSWIACPIWGGGGGLFTKLK